MINKKVFGRYPRLLALLCIGSLTACVTQTETTLNKPRYTSSLITISEPNFAIRPGASFAWYRDIQQFATEDDAVDAEVIAHVQARINQNLTEQGFTLTNDLSSARHWLAAAVIMGNAVTEQDLVEHYDISPALQNDGNYETGTLVLRVLKPLSLTTDWRGAMEIFTEPDQSISQRREKVDSSIDNVMRQLLQHSAAP